MGERKAREAACGAAGRKKPGNDREGSNSWDGAPNNTKDRRWTKKKKREGQRNGKLFAFDVGVDAWGVFEGG